MSLYDIDYNNFTQNVSPVDKRLPKLLSWVYSLLYPIQYDRNLFFDTYRTGSTYALYSAGTYGKGDRVQYQKAVYESLKASNTDAPSVITSWTKIQDNFIGLDERLMYNGQKVVLEYGLNKWFGTTFRQPGGSNSDIYITTNANSTPVFRVGLIESRSSNISTVGSSEYVSTADYAAASFINFVIHVPVAVYNALDSISTNREKIFRSFTDLFVVAGLTYQVLTY